MRVLWPKCCAKYDELALKNIKQHVGPPSHFYKRPNNKDCQQDPRKIGPPAVKLSNYLFGINPIPFSIFPYCGKRITKFFRIQIRIFGTHFFEIKSGGRQLPPDTRIVNQLVPSASGSTSAIASEDSSATGSYFSPSGALGLAGVLPTNVSI